MTSGFVSRQHAARPALIVEGGATLGYAELHEAIDALAAQLPPRQLIFIVGDNDLPTVLCYLASLARGTVPLLLHKGLDRRPAGSPYSPHTIRRCFSCRLRRPVRDRIARY